MNTSTTFPIGTPVIEMTEPSRREQTQAAPDPHSRTRLSWKYAILGWIFLAIEVTVMAALYQRGEGRTARNIYIFGICEIFGCDKEAFSATSVFNESGEVVSSDSSDDEEQCIIGEGPPYLAEVLALRAAIATLSQLFALCRPNACLWIPHKATFAVMFKCFECCCKLGEESGDNVERDRQVRTEYINTRTGRTERVEYGTGASGIYFCCMVLFMGTPVAVLSLYSWYPAYCGIQAVCELVTHATFGLGFAICALVCSCCCASGGIIDGEVANEDEKDLRRSAVSMMLILDSLLVGIFFVWGNFVQSGFAALAFALVPAFNISVLFSNHL